MASIQLAAPLLLVLAAAAQPPLPGLRIEPTGGGSIFSVHNSYSEPLTAYLIELVNYPGSSYSLWYDELESPIAGGAEQRIQVANMTVGAVPDYVKMQAAIFADGTTAGIPAKVTNLIERRKAVLETTRELIRRCRKGPDKAAVIADLQEWVATMPPVTRANRNSQAAINQGAAQGLVGKTARDLSSRSVDQVVADLRISETRLMNSKPEL